MCKYYTLPCLNLSCKKHVIHIILANKVHGRLSDNDILKFLFSLSETCKERALKDRKVITFKQGTQIKSISWRDVYEEIEPHFNLERVKKLITII